MPMLTATLVATSMLVTVLTSQWVAARGVLETEEPAEALLVG